MTYIQKQQKTFACSLILLLAMNNTIVCMDAK